MKYLPKITGYQIRYKGIMSDTPVKGGFATRAEAENALAAIQQALTITEEHPAIIRSFYICAERRK